MSFSTTPILLERKMRAHEVIEHVEFLPLRDGIQGNLTLQCLTVGGNITVKLEYSNRVELGFLFLEEIDFTDSVMDIYEVKKLIPCKFLKFTITNTSDTPTTCSIVPCFI